MSGLSSDNYYLCVSVKHFFQSGICLAKPSSNQSSILQIFFPPDIYLATMVLETEEIQSMI